jgi:hypothetical protein
LQSGPQPDLRAGLQLRRLRSPQSGTGLGRRFRLPSQEDSQVMRIAGADGLARGWRRYASLSSGWNTIGNRRIHEGLVARPTWAGEGIDAEFPRAATVAHHAGRLIDASAQACLATSRVI